MDIIEKLKKKYRSYRSVNSFEKGIVGNAWGRESKDEIVSWFFVSRTVCHRWVPVGDGRLAPVYRFQLFIWSDYEVLLSGKTISTSYVGFLRNVLFRIRQPYKNMPTVHRRSRSARKVHINQSQHSWNHYENSQVVGRNIQEKCIVKHSSKCPGKRLVCTVFK